MKFRKKPVVIEATQFHADDTSTHAHVNYGYPKADNSTHPLDGKYWIGTLEGEHVVSEGDWIITGVKGEHYPCKPDIFVLTYDEADAPLPPIADDNEYADVVVRADEYKRRTRPEDRLPAFTPRG